MSIINNMPAKTGGKNYQLVHGRKSQTSGKSITLEFESKIIAVFYAAGQTYMDEIMFSSAYVVNVNSYFFEGYENMFDNSYPKSTDVTYTSSNSRYVRSVLVDEKTIRIDSSLASGNYLSSVTYTAILEIE